MFARVISALLALVVICRADLFINTTCPPIGTAYFAHENCSKYVVCDHGIPHTLDCPASLYFNPVSELCDFAYNVPECVGGTRPPSGNTTVTPPINSTTVTPPINSTTLRPPINGTTLTPPINSTTVRPPINGTTLTPPINGTTLRPPINGTTLRPPINGTTLTPPINGTTFTPPINSTTVRPPINGTTLRPPINSTTTQRVNSTTPAPPGNSTSPSNGTHCSPDLPFSQCPCPYLGFYFTPYPGNCSLYVHCVEGVALLNVCPNGTLFNPVKLQCDYASSANCTNNSTYLSDFESRLESSDSEPECSQNEAQPLVPSSTNCQEYFICHNGVSKGKGLCPDGHHFDYFSQSCVPQGLTTCLL